MDKIDLNLVIAQALASQVDAAAQTKLLANLLSQAMAEIQALKKELELKK
jgi:hypothetical protein